MARVWPTSARRKEAREAGLLARERGYSLASGKHAVAITTARLK
jgi:hypothetical protein